MLPALELPVASRGVLQFIAHRVGVLALLQGVRVRKSQASMTALRVANRMVNWLRFSGRWTDSPHRLMRVCAGDVGDLDGEALTRFGREELQPREWRAESFDKRGLARAEECGDKVGAGRIAGQLRGLDAAVDQKVVTRLCFQNTL